MSLSAAVRAIFATLLLGFRALPAVCAADAVQPPALLKGRQRSIRGLASLDARLQESIDSIEIFLRVSHDESGAVGQICSGAAGGEDDAGGGQILLH